MSFSNKWFFYSQQSFAGDTEECGLGDGTTREVNEWAAIG